MSFAAFELFLLPVMKDKEVKSRKEMQVTHRSILLPLSAQGLILPH